MADWERIKKHSQTYWLISGILTMASYVVWVVAIGLALWTGQYWYLSVSLAVSVLAYLVKDVF